MNSDKYQLDVENGKHTKELLKGKRRGCCGWFTNRPLWVKILLIVLLVLFLAVVGIGSFVLHIWLTVWKDSDTADLSAGAFNCSSKCTNVDHSLWTEVLDNVLIQNVTRKGITFNAVDFDLLRTDESIREIHRDYLNILQTTDITKLKGGNQAVAFLINAYNAFAVDLIVKENVQGSIRDLSDFIKGSVFKRFKWEFNDGGNITQVSLDDVEHEQLRKTVTDYDDPRVHAAVNCVSLSCPDLYPEAFTASKLDKQLDDAMTKWMANPSKGLRIDKEKNEVHLSAIFTWFSGDFISKEKGGQNDLTDAGSQLEFAIQFASEEDRQYVEENNPAVKFMGYEWDLIRPNPPAP